MGEASQGITMGRAQVFVFICPALAQENMEKRGKYEQREKKLAAKICARKSVQGFVLSGGEGELGVDGGSNGQKNITFDLSIGGEESAGRIDSS